MKSKIQISVLLLLAAGCLLLLYQRYFPNEERRIRRLLAGVAQAASVPEHPSVTARLAAADRLRDYLTAGVEVEVDVPGGGRQTLAGRQEIIQGVLTAQAQLPRFQIEFLDLSVTLDAERQTAQTELTARVRQGADPNWVVQELKFQLKKEDGQWRVAKVETVKTLKL